MRRDERKKKDNLEKLEKEIEAKKKLPKEVKEKINSKVFENVVILVIIMVYFVALNLGMNNIPTENYIMDLKVFSIMLLVITIMTFEFGYKKDDGGIWLHGVEIMAIRSVYIILNRTIFYILYNLWDSSTCSCHFIFDILCNKNCNNTKENGNRI
ncbi:MAG: hypothetical protein HFJ54_01195 [Clostridia bacterium]|nr:hypothetical protein [Clostridia bacterium]